MTIKIFSVEEMVAAEKAADASGVSYDQMMETAGRCVAEAIMERVEINELPVLILVGPGNNGGDGLVAGRYLALAGADVVFYLYKAREAEEDRNYALVEHMNLLTVLANEDLDLEKLKWFSENCEVLVDSFLGTGVTRPIEGNLANLMRAVKEILQERSQWRDSRNRLTSVAGVQQGQPSGDFPFITAVDCPSGLNCDSGALDPLAIEADLTVTFAGPKRGHFMFPGASACGELVVADIEISSSLPQVSSIPLLLATAEMARQLLPDRGLDGHKGTFGTALIAAGSHNYWGAPFLAAQGAYRSGAGLVALAVPESIRSTIAGQMPEATYPAIEDNEMLGEAAAERVAAMFDTIKSLLVGPGLDSADGFMRKLLNEITTFSQSGNPQIPLVIDADGLNIIAQWQNWPKELPAHTILTPHPGEMARLMGVDLDQVREADRVQLAGSQAQEWNHVLVLKGAFTIVAAPDGRCTLVPFANPLLAVGGSGDVLAGVITGLLAQGLGNYEAAVLGSYLHGAAAALASEQFGDAGMLSGELAAWIPQVRKSLIGWE